MRRLRVAPVRVGVLVPLLLAGCTSPNRNAPPPPPSGGAGTGGSAPTGRPFPTDREAVIEICQAYWVGEYIQNTHRTEIQWETRAQFRTGTGQVASIARTAAGVEVLTCHDGGYTHA